MKFKKVSYTVVVMMLFQLLSSCFVTEEVGCEESVDYVKGDYINMVITDLAQNWNSDRTDYSGISIDSGEKVRFKSGSMMYVYMNDYPEIGDTLKKNRGNLNVMLLKKDSVFVFNFFCGEIYLDFKKNSFGRPLNAEDSLLVQKLYQTAL
jgi:hypothetical protein